MKIPLKAITVVYTQTRTFTPTTEMFEDWDVQPTQEEFEVVMRGEFYDMIYEEMSGKGNPRDYTHVEQLATVEIEYEPFEIVEFKFIVVFSTVGVYDIVVIDIVLIVLSDGLIEFA